MKVLATQRLYLREFTAEDAASLYRLNLDPDVLKYTGDEPFENRQAAQTFIANYDHYQKYGFGRWAVINKSNGDFLGWCGLKYTPETDEVDIGFRFYKQHWNQGYATEAAKPCIELGFNKFQITEIVGRAIKENKASIHVLEKVGLTYRRDLLFAEKEAVLYKIKCPTS